MKLHNGKKLTFTLKILSLLLGISMIFGTVFGISGLNFSAKNTADASNVGTALVLDDGNGKFDVSALKTLFGRIVSGAKSYSDVDKAISDEHTGEVSIDYSTMANLGMTTVSMGGMEWNAVAASKDANGEVVLTLWLSNQPYTSRFSDANFSTNASSTYAPSEYGMSLVRSTLVGGHYAISTTAQSATEGEQNPIWSSFLGNYGDYIDTPSQIAYQGTENAPSAISSGWRYLPNEAYNYIEANISTSGGGVWYSSTIKNIQNCTGYANWASDKLWLPSISETGYSTTYTGLWKINNNTVRASGGTYSWLRSGTYSSATAAYGLTADGSNYSGNLTYSNLYGVRPALHLNLKSAANAASGAVAPSLTDDAKGGITFNNGAQEAVNFDSEKSYISKVEYTDNLGNETVAEYTAAASGAGTLSKVTYTASGGTPIVVSGATAADYTTAWQFDYENGLVKATDAGTFTLTASLRTPIWDGTTYLDGEGNVVTHGTPPSDLTDLKPWRGTAEDGEMPNFWEIPVSEDKVEWKIGTQSVQFTVEQAEISASDVTGIAATYIYKGEVWQPEPSVSVTLAGSAVALVKDDDFSVSYSTSAYTAGTEVTVTVKGVGNFKGTVTKTFEILKATPKITSVQRVTSGTLYEGAIPPALSCVAQYTPTGGALTDVAGTIKIDADRLTKGENQSYSWTFTPDDETDFESVTGSIELTVEEAAVASLQVVFDYERYFNDLKGGSANKVFTSTSISGNLLNIMSGYLSISGEMTDGTPLPEGYGYSLSRVNNAWPATLAGLNVWTGSVGAGWADLADGSAPITVNCGNFELNNAFSVPVTYVKLDRIAVTENPDVSSYTALSEFDKTGMVVTAYYNDNSNKAVTSYTVAYNNGHDAIWYGDNSVTISYTEVTGGGEERTQTTTVGISVSRKHFSTSGLSLSDANKPYNGEAQTITLSGDVPDGITIRYAYYLNNSAITADKVVNVVANGYTVRVTLSTSSDSTELGYNYVLDGTTQFSATLMITKIDYEGLSDITFEGGNAEYSASSKAGVLKVENVPEGVVVSYTYYKNGTEISADEVADMGKYTVVASFTVDGNHNDIADMSAELEIIAHTLVADEVSGVESSYVYKGEAWKPEPVVTVELGGVDTVLTKGTDYEVAYSTEDYSAGTKVTVTVTGKGNYTGSVTKTFTINKAKLELTWEYNGSGVYDGTVHEAELKISGGVFNTDKVDMTDAALAGFITIIYTTDDGGLEHKYAGTYKPSYNGYPETTSPWSNYEPSVTNGSFTFTIKEAVLPTITFDDKEVIYDGELHFMAITVTDGVLNTDEITVTYYFDTTNRVFVGRRDVDVNPYRVRVEIKCTTGNYTIPDDVAQMYAYLTIKPKEITDGDVSGVNASYVYAGADITPNVKVEVKLTEDNTVTLSPVTNYELSYEGDRLNATADGDVVTVKIKGVGNFSGEVTKTFVITKLRLEFDWVGEEDTYTYNGAGQGVTAEFTNVPKRDEATVVPALYYKGDTGTAYAETKDKPVNAGNYVVTLKWEVDDDNYYGFDDYSVKFSIGKATPNVTVNFKDYDPSSKRLYTGQLLPDIVVTSSGLNATVTSVAGDVSWQLVDGAQPVLKLNSNDYVWVFEPTGDDANNFTSATGKLTIQAYTPTFASMTVRWNTEDGQQPFLWSSTTITDLRDYLWVEATLDDGTDFGRVTADYVLRGSWGNDASPKLAGFDETANWDLTISLGAVTPHKIEDVLFNVVTIDYIELKGANGGAITTTYSGLSEFDIDSIVVVAHFKDGSVIEGVTGYEVIYQQADKRLWVGNTSVTISYKYLNEVVTADVDGLVVNPIIYDTSDIAFDSQSVNLDYDGNEHGLLLSGEEKFDIGNISYTYYTKNASGDWVVMPGVSSVTDAGEYRVDATFVIVDDPLIGEGVYTRNYTLDVSLKRALLTINKIKYEGADDIKFATSVVADYNGDETNLYAADIEKAATGVSDEVWGIVSYEYRTSITGQPLPADEAVHAGSYIVTVIFNTDANHYEIAPVRISLTVNKIAPVVKPQIVGHPIKGVAIAEISLVNAEDGTKGFFEWTSYGQFDASTYVLHTGANVVHYTFTPDNTQDYEIVSAQFTITAKDNYPVYMYATVSQGDTELFTSYTLERLLALAADENEDLSIKVYVVFNDGTTEEITDYDVVLLSGNELLDLGDCYLKFSYVLDGELFTYTEAFVKVHLNGLGSISASFEQNGKKIYTSDDINSLLKMIEDGEVSLVVNSYYADGDFKAELEAYEYGLSGDWSAMTADGKFSVVVTMHGESVTATFEIDVTAVVLTGISADFDQIDKSIYASDGISALESAITDGGVRLAVTAYYNDGSERVLEFGEYSVAIDGLLFVVGTNEVTVSFGGQEDTFEVEVTGVLVVGLSAKISDVDYKIYTDTALSEVEKLLTVIAYYNDGTQGAVTDFKLKMPDGSDKLTAGTQVVVNLDYTGSDKADYFEEFGLIIGVVKHETVITFTGDTVYTFDGSTRVIDGGAATNHADDETLSYEIGGGIAVIRNADEYELVITSAETDDYYAAVLTVTITVNKADYDLSDVVFEGKTVVYDGTKQYLVVGGSLPMNVFVSGYSYVDASGAPCGDVSATDAGEYTVTVSFGAFDTDNYNAIPDMVAKLVIEKAEAEVDESGLFANVYTYNGEEQVVTGATIIRADDGAEIVYANNAFTDVPEGGVLHVVISVAEGANYKAFERVVEITVNRAKLTVTANDFAITYGDAPANDGVTAVGFVNEADEELLNSLVYSYDYSQYGNAGAYEIALSGVSSGNYEIELVAGVLTVDKAEVSVEWVIGNYVYDGLAHRPSATFEDLFGAKIELTVTVANKLGGIISDAIAAGEYVATASTTNPNYELKDTVRDFSIVATADNWIKFDFRKDYFATYGSVPETAEELAALAEELVNSSYVRVDYNLNGEITDLDTVIRLMTVRLEVSDGVLVDSATPVGRYNIYFEFKPEYAENYASYTVYQTVENTENTNLGRFVIESRALTIDWGNTQFKFNGEAHLLTATVKGFVDGDTPVSFTMTEKGGEFAFEIDGTTVKFTLSVNGDLTSVGGHTVTAVIDDGNYVLTNAHATLSISEAGGFTTLTWGLIGAAGVLALIAIIAIIVAARRKAAQDEFDAGGFNELYYEEDEGGEN